MDDNFFRSLFPGKHVVLGRRLPLFSLWHSLALHAVDSPFVDPDDDRDASLPDLLLAVKICRGARWPLQPSLAPGLRDICTRFRLRKEHRNRVRETIAAELAKFAFYIQCHEIRPEFWENEAELVPKRLTAPEILARVASLERKTNFTHSQIWNDLSPGYVSWLAAAIAEQEGAELRFARPEDNEEPDLPDLTKATTEELFEIVKADMGEEYALDWLERRHLEEQA